VPSDDTLSRGGYEILRRNIDRSAKARAARLRAAGVKVLSCYPSTGPFSRIRGPEASASRGP